MTRTRSHSAVYSRSIKLVRSQQSRRTICNWMNKGKLQYVLLPSGHRRIYEDELIRSRE